jgi:hypothetical protein
VEVFAEAQAAIDSQVHQGLKSDGVLAAICEGLKNLGYQVESGKHASEKIDRPVLYGDQGLPLVRYQVDAWLDDPGVVVEVEAGRGIMGNAFYRDLVRGSLIVGARFMVIAVMSNYQYKSGGKLVSSRDYELVRDQLDAIYGSGRLSLPFDGVLLVGY